MSSKFISGFLKLLFLLFFCNTASGVEFILHYLPLKQYVCNSSVFKHRRESYSTEVSEGVNKALHIIIPCFESVPSSCFHVPFICSKFFPNARYLCQQWVCQAIFVHLSLSTLFHLSFPALSSRHSHLSSPLPLSIFSPFPPLLIPLPFLASERFHLYIMSPPDKCGC